MIEMHEKCCRKVTKIFFPVSCCLHSWVKWCWSEVVKSHAVTSKDTSLLLIWFPVEWKALLPRVQMAFKLKSIWCPFWTCLQFKWLMYAAWTSALCLTLARLMLFLYYVVTAEMDSSCWRLTGHDSMTACTLFEFEKAIAWILFNTGLD
jgi:hypothetical protein